MTDRAAYFLQLSLKRARKRKHRMCPAHKVTRVVCPTCAKMRCPRPACAHRCLTSPLSKAPRAKRPAKLRPSAPVPVYHAPARFAPLWRVIRPMGAVRIEPHPDADAFKMIFAPQSLNLSSAGELADKLWSTSAISILAQETPFRAGRGFKPAHWWVSFTLRTTTKESA